MTTKILYVANTICLAIFLGMAFLLPMYGQSEANERLRNLPSHESAMPSMPGDLRGTGNSGATWIVEPSLTGVRAASNLGIAVTLLNVSLFFAGSFDKKKKKA